MDLSSVTRVKEIEGLREKKALEKARRIRAPGGGRKPICEHDPTLRQDVERLVEPATRGAPVAPLRWTCKSTRQLAATLQAQGHEVGRQKVADLLAELGYSLQANRKAKLTGVYNLSDHDSYIEPAVTWSKRDFNIEAGVDVMSGPRDTFFGGYSQNDRFFITMTYKF